MVLRSTIKDAAARSAVIMLQVKEEDQPPYPPHGPPEDVSQPQQRGEVASKAYLALLLLERENLEPYKELLPICGKLLEGGMTIINLI